MPSSSPTTTSAPPQSSSFYSSIATVAVAQISQSVGYYGAQSSALRSLSDIAGNYLRSLASLAADRATSNGRTETNIFDVIIAIEHLASPRGFSGASDLGRPLLRSSVIKDIIRFLQVVDEIPFARPTGRRLRRRKSSGLTFAQAGRDPPPYVPRWLPEFPQLCGKRVASPEREARWPSNQQEERIVGNANDECQREGKCDSGKRATNLAVVAERKRMRFRLKSASGKVSKDSLAARKGFGKEVVSVAKEIDGGKHFFGSMRTAHCRELNSHLIIVFGSSSS